MNTFEELSASRRDWIDSVLKPWCQTAARAELVKAELEWHNLAGRVDPDATLWAWAWSRFPVLVHEELHRIDETCEIEVELQNGRRIRGFPDARQTVRGRLALVITSETATGDDANDTFSIDDIITINRI
ncbi:MAG: hypothetical protein IID45_09375 [Planctomycetes bacterium]|nr:hypothetical protein [Planctomycetota bacterium]